MASSGKHVAAMGSTQKKSKKTVECGICGHNARRDYLKGTHFPKIHPRERYKERGEKTLTCGQLMLLSNWSHVKKIKLRGIPSYSSHV